MNAHKTCKNCKHWVKVDITKIFWEGQPPDEYQCAISDIERRWSHPSAIVEAGLSQGPEQKLEVIALNCPEFTTP